MGIVSLTGSENRVQASDLSRRDFWYQKEGGCHYSPVGENNNSLARASARGTWVESQLQYLVARVVIGPEVGGGGRAENGNTGCDSRHRRADLCECLGEVYEVIPEFTGGYCGAK